MLIIITILILISVFSKIVYVEIKKAKCKVLITALCKFAAICPVLIAGIIMARANPSPYAWIIVGGLALGLVGDLAIIKKFIIGLIMFLCGHIAYIIGFCMEKPFFAEIASLAGLLSLFFYLAFGIAMYVILWPKLNLNITGKKSTDSIITKIAVGGYVVAIVLMSWQSLTRFLFFDNQLMLLAAIGAPLFMISDSTLAFQTFHHNHPIAQMINISEHGEAILFHTYIVAQWLIALSILAI